MSSRWSGQAGGAQIYFKREDLNHTGAHKINNVIGQALLARRMGKKRIIAETGAGQHGVATATICARFGLECVVYMGSEDVKRQAQNVYRMKLLGEYGAVAIGEVGADDSLAVMAEYTEGGDKLHMAYSFNLLTPVCSARHIRSQVEQFGARVKDGWASWSVGNHDSIRVMTRWGGDNPSPEMAKLVLAMQLSLKGTPCLYQGDELAFTEADVPFELLQDPYGITFWPEFKGRDGCRTPIAWSQDANGGFTSGKPWLPVDEKHIARAASLQEADAASPLAFARKIIAWRRTMPQLTRGDVVFFDTPEPVLA
eukprot:gene38177-47130_t